MSSVLTKIGKFVTAANLRVYIATQRVPEENFNRITNIVQNASLRM